MTRTYILFSERVDDVAEGEERLVDRLGLLQCLAFSACFAHLFIVINITIAKNSRQYRPLSGVYYELHTDDTSFSEQACHQRKMIAKISLHRKLPTFSEPAKSIKMSRLLISLFKCCCVRCRMKML